MKIGKIVEQYFVAVRERWPEAWAYRGSGIMLNRTNGFRALMRLSGRANGYLGHPGDMIAASQFLELFRKVEADSKFFAVETFRPGSSGEAALYRFFKEQIFGD